MHKGRPRPKSAALLSIVLVALPPQAVATVGPEPQGDPVAQIVAWIPTVSSAVEGWRKDFDSKLGELLGPLSEDHLLRLEREVEAEASRKPTPDVRYEQALAMLRARLVTTCVDRFPQCPGGLWERAHKVSSFDVLRPAATRLAEKYRASPDAKHTEALEAIQRAGILAEVRAAQTREADWQRKLETRLSFWLDLGTPLPEASLGAVDALRQTYPEAEQFREASAILHARALLLWLAATDPSSNGWEDELKRRLAPIASEQRLTRVMEAVAVARARSFRAAFTKATDGCGEYQSTFNKEPASPRPAAPSLTLLDSCVRKLSERVERFSKLAASHSPIPSASPTPSPSPKPAEFPALIEHEGAGDPSAPDPYSRQSHEAYRNLKSWWKPFEKEAHKADKPS
jgi:hypothetical protein